MKKLAISLVAVVSALIMCFAVSACDLFNSKPENVDVAGKTFVLDKFEVSYASDVDAETKAYFDNYAKDMNSLSAAEKENYYIAFNKDGTCSVMGSEFYYTQDGGTVKLYYDNPAEDEDAELSTTLTVTESTLVQEDTEDGVTIKATYKLKETANDDNNDNTPVNVAGKTFVYDRTEVSYASGVDAETKAYIDEMVKEFNAMSEAEKAQMTIVFNKDGSCKLMDEYAEYYVQNGNRVEAYDVNPADNKDAQLIGIFTVKGNTIVSEDIATEGVTMIGIFKLKETANDGDKDDNKEDNKDDNKGDGTAVNVAGKAFVPDKMEVSYSGDVDSEIKERYDSMITAFNNMTEAEKEQLTVVFNKEGTCISLDTIQYYVQNGNRVEVYDVNPADNKDAQLIGIFTVRGNTIVSEDTAEGITMIGIFNLK